MRKVGVDGAQSAVKCAVKDWNRFKTDVYSAEVSIFIGSREDMCASAYDAFISGDSPMDIDRAKSFTKSMNETFGKSIEGINGECLSFKNDYGERMWVVRMDGFSGSVDDTVVLSHECLHAALSVLGECGVSENAPYEALCYLHEALFKKFMMFAFGRIGKLKFVDG